MRILYTEYLNKFSIFPWWASVGIIILMFTAVSIGVTLIGDFINLGCVVRIVIGLVLIIAPFVILIWDPFGWRDLTNVVYKREVIFNEDFKESADYLELMRTYEVDKIKGDIWVLKPRERMVDEE